ncbi:ArsR family transcriptional regulator [Candidatus Lokiarchaeum ossiferum]|uniref:ArsR family transcriptional regulator n=1 Tax=Candidatus Lokiarchaeum ossiferum TaxID=2951803 RepID=UPI00352E7C1A
MPINPINSTQKSILQYIRKITTTTKDLYLDQIKSRVSRKFKLSISVVEGYISDLISKAYLLIDEDNLEVNILANPIRKQILELITTYPGIYPHLIKSILNTGTNQLIWHLSVLEINSLIKFKEFGKIKAYSLPEIPSVIITIGFVALKASSRKLLHFLCKTPGPSRNDIMEHLQMAKSTTDYWLKKLKKLQLLFTEKEGVTKHYLSKEYRTKICSTLKQFKTLINI